MSYATPEDMLTRYGADELAQMSDPFGTGEADAAVIDRALADAHAEIDAYLIGRYSLPLAHVPAALARIACDIARYRLWADRASDEVRRRYEDARRLLEQIGNGSVSIGPLVNAQPSVGSMQIVAAPARDWGILQ
jgi:phage gp36-like protein